MFEPGLNIPIKKNPLQSTCTCSVPYIIKMICSIADSSAEIQSGPKKAASPSCPSSRRPFPVGIRSPIYYMVLYQFSRFFAQLTRVPNTQTRRPRYVRHSNTPHLYTACRQCGLIIINMRWSRQEKLPKPYRCAVTVTDTTWEGEVAESSR